MFEKADEVIAAARECIGTPFRHQGRLPGVGLDCAGLGIVAANAAGIDIKDFAGYPRLPFDGMLKKMFDEQPQLKQIDKRDAQPGDVFIMRNSHEPEHIAIASENGYIIHSSWNIRKVVEQRLDELLRNRIVYVYRFVLGEADHE